MGFEISKDAPSQGLTRDNSLTPAQTNSRQIPSHIVEAMNCKAYTEDLIRCYQASTCFLPGESVATQLKAIMESIHRTQEASERRERIFEEMKLKLFVEKKLWSEEKGILIARIKTLTAQVDDVIERNKCLEDADYGSKEKISVVSAENLRLHALTQKHEKKILKLENKIIDKKRKEKLKKSLERLSKIMEFDPQSATLEIVSKAVRVATSSTSNKTDVDLNQEAFNS